MQIKKFRVHYGTNIFIGDDEATIVNNILREFPGSDRRELEERVKLTIRPNDNIVTGKSVDMVNVGMANPGGLTLKDAVNGASAILKTVKGDIVPQEEINRRAYICSTCPQRKETSGCKACGAGAAIVKYTNTLKTFFGRGFHIPEGLGKDYCNICGCSLAPMLPSKITCFHEKPQINLSRPKHCWVNVSSPNFVRAE